MFFINIKDCSKTDEQSFHLGQKIGDVSVLYILFQLTLHIEVNLL